MHRQWVKVLSENHIVNYFLFFYFFAYAPCVQGAYAAPMGDAAAAGLNLTGVQGRVSSHEIGACASSLLNGGFMLYG